VLASSRRLFYKSSLFLREFFSPRSIGGILTPEGLRGCSFSGHPERVYLCVSHALLSFYPLDLPSNLSEEKKKAAAKLEALRLHRLFSSHTVPLVVSFCFGSEGKAWALVLEKELLDASLKQLPASALLSGVFPAWVALWAYFQPREDGLYFLETPWSYEGFILDRGQIAEFVPASRSLGRIFLKNFSGKIFKAQGDPVQVLIEASKKVPLTFLDAPTFEGYPLKIRPKVPKKILLLWFLPLSFFALTQGLTFYEKRLETTLSILNRNLSQARKAYEQLQIQRQKYELSLKIQSNVKPYFQNRPHLLEILKVLTQTFPEGSWIRRLEFRSPNEVRIWAEGRGALKILERLNQSSLFTEVHFGSSVTKNPITGKERFYLILKLKPIPSK